MAATIHERALPDHALLGRYVDSGDYTDCFATEIPRTVSHRQFVEAFYTTFVFRAERLVLKWLASRPSTDDDVRALAAGRSDTFAAWRVESRAPDQILLKDFRGQTCSWLMIEPLGDDRNAATRLYFGSAVIKADEAASGRKALKTGYRLLLGFHRVYSRILLNAARNRL